MNTDVILYVLMIDFLAIISPGPDFFMVLKNTLTDSLKAGFYTTLGVSLGSTIVFSLGLFGVGIIVVNSHIMFALLQYFGGGYLGYLGIKSIISKPHVHEPELTGKDTQQINKFQYFRIGLLCNLTNPKSFFFIISLSTYVAENAHPLIDGWFILLGSIIGTMIWFTFVSFVFGRASVRKIFYAKQKIINIVFGIILIYVASKIITL